LPAEDGRNRVGTATPILLLVQNILTTRGLSEILVVEILEEEEVKLKQAPPGRRTRETQYTWEVRLRFDLTWKVALSL